MKTINFNINNLQQVAIGYSGENVVSSVSVDYSEWVSTYGSGTIALAVQRPQDKQPYPVTLEVVDSVATWHITSTDTEQKGWGEGQFSYYLDGQDEPIKKSQIFRFFVLESLVTEGDVPDPYQSWYDDVLEATTHYPRVIDGYWYLWSNGQWVDSGVKAEGTDGAKGDDGADGFSPIIQVSDISGGHRITITDASGTRSVDVMDGEKGSDGERGADGADGYSPTVAVSDITGGHRLTITDATGTKTADILDGAKGDTGATGADGYSPTISVSTITGGHRISITDASGTQTVDVMDGDPASNIVTDVQINGTSILDNGVADIPFADNQLGVVKIPPGNGLYISPFTGELLVSTAGSDAIKEGTNVYRPISPQKQHEATFYGLAKASGDATQSQSSNPVGNYTDDAKASIRSMLDVPSTDDIPTVPVTDVQVNGTSILDSGVANVPVATDSSVGVVKVSTTYGLDMGTTAQHVGFIRIYPPLDSIIKRGDGYYNPVTVSKQHQAVFYGLAKASGDSTQSASSNAVGVYTDEAKVKIQKMLGIYEAPWELIREDTFTNAEEADYEITVDGNGQAFDLTDLYLELWLIGDTVEASQGSSGRVDCYYNSTEYFSQYLNATTVVIGGNPRGACLMIENKKGAIIRQNTAYNTMGTDRQAIYTPGRVDTNRSYMIFVNYTFKKIKIKSIKGKCSYRLLGKRKWS